MHLAPSRKESSTTPFKPSTETFLQRHWLWPLLFLLALFVGLPWLAPVFMELGWTRLGHFIYTFYSTQCHQLPQRSFFLFGPRSMLTLEQIQTVWQNSNNPLVLRQFVGNAAVGWKVAWSDRMVYMYSSIIPIALFYWPWRRCVQPLAWWGWGLLLLPMLLDGGTHLISDLSGIGNGFRDSNAWLAMLTNNRFPPQFYAGDALGSFNSWMRLLSGLAFAICVVWGIFPYIQHHFAPTNSNV